MDIIRGCYYSITWCSTHSFTLRSPKYDPSTTRRCPHCRGRRLEPLDAEISPFSEKFGPPVMGFSWGSLESIATVGWAFSWVSTALGLLWLGGERTSIAARDFAVFKALRCSGGQAGGTISLVPQGSAAEEKDLFLRSLEGGSDNNTLMRVVYLVLYCHL